MKKIKERILESKQVLALVSFSKRLKISKTEESITFQWLMSQFFHPPSRPTGIKMVCSSQISLTSLLWSIGLKVPINYDIMVKC